MSLAKIFEEELLYVNIISVQTEEVVQRCFVKKSVLKRKTPVPESFFKIKLQTSACNFIKKETLALMFFCEFCEIFKNTFFYRTPLVAASDVNSSMHLLTVRQNPVSYV